MERKYILPGQQRSLLKQNKNRRNSDMTHADSLETGCLHILFMGFSLLSPLEFFVDPKNVDGRNNKPPAMRVRVDCYTKKLPFRVQ